MSSRVATHCDALIDLLEGGSQAQVEASGPGVVIIGRVLEGSRPPVHDLDFLPRVSLLSRLDKFDLKTATATTIGCVGACLRGEKGEAALLLNWETVVLRRDQEELRLDESCGVWTAENLELLGSVSAHPGETGDPSLGQGPPA